MPQPMRNKQTFAIALAATVMIAGPAFAEGGWTSSQLSDPKGDRGDVGPSGTGKDPYLGQTVNIINTGNASGISTAPGSSYSTQACCTLAPGGLPKGDEVNTLTLFELARGEDPQGVRVRTVPRFHGLFPPTAVYSWSDTPWGADEDLLAQQSSRHGHGVRSSSGRSGGPISDGRRGNSSNPPR